MPKYVVRTQDRITGRDLPAALLDAPDGAAAADVAGAPDIRVTLVEAYTVEMGSLPDWPDVLAKYQQSRVQPGHGAGRAFATTTRVALLTGAWVTSVVLGALLFSGFSAQVAVANHVAEMEKVIDSERTGRPPNAEASLRAKEAQQFIDTAGVHQHRLFWQGLGLALGLTAMDSLLLLALSWLGRHWHWGSALVGVVVFGLVLSEIQQWILYGLQVRGANSGSSYAGLLVCVVLAVTWLLMVRVLREPSAVPAL